MTCGYVLEIKSIDTNLVHYKLIEATKENTQGSTPDLCKKMLDQKTSLPLDEVKLGKEWLKPSTQLKARWSSYTGMGPKGAISSSTWEFFKP